MLSWVNPTSDFETDKTEQHPVYLLSKSGADIRELDIDQSCVFVMTDHTPMPKKTFSSMARQGVVKVAP